jgi:hypothetical protein
MRSPDRSTEPRRYTVQYLLLITGDLSQPTSQAEIDRVMGEYWSTTRPSPRRRVAAPLLA